MPARSCECGECKKCEHRIYMNEWYRKAGNADRVRARVKAYRKRVPDQRKGFREYDKEKTKARRALHHAVAAGRIVKQDCESCGDSDSQAHHEDYSQPLVVRWLCSRCHGIEHRTIP